jgi:glucose-6-phosphate isomerase
MGALPLTAVNTRDLHSRAQQHQEGKRDKVMTNVIVEKPRHDLLKIPNSDLNQDDLNRHAGKTMLGELVVVTATPKGYEELGRKTVVGKTRQAPAIANGLLYLRDDREMDRRHRHSITSPHPEQHGERDAH